jgi:hypothetical protein
MLHADLVLITMIKLQKKICSENTFSTIILHSAAFHHINSTSIIANVLII